MVTAPDPCTGNGVDGNPQPNPGQIPGMVQRLDGDRCLGSVSRDAQDLVHAEKRRIEKGEAPCTDIPKAHYSSSTAGLLLPLLQQVDGLKVGTVGLLHRIVSWKSSLFNASQRRSSLSFPVILLITTPEFGYAFMPTSNRVKYEVLRGTLFPRSLRTSWRKAGEFDFRRK